METISQKQTRGRLQPPARQSLGEGNRVRRNNQEASISPRPRSTCTCSNRPGSVRCSKHGYLVPSDKLRRNQANTEILRRALAPPNRRERGMTSSNLYGMKFISIESNSGCIFKSQRCSLINMESLRIMFKGLSHVTKPQFPFHERGQLNVTLLLTVPADLIVKLPLDGL
ncbi:hypothetical protein NC652_004151 [Populus alba x Populus x berolinensis]|nr:hypothetical protein NC652_004151 [Populus alba x Populus x berolinensis]